jgi:hypothetical protein
VIVDKYKGYKIINDLIIKQEQFIFENISNDISQWKYDSLINYTTFLKYSDDDRRC